MSRLVTTIVVLLTAAYCLAGGGPTLPGRYQTPPKTKGVRLQSVLGEPEQPGAPGLHTSAITPDGKIGIYAGGGTVDADGATEDSFLSVWDVPGNRLLREIKIARMSVTALAFSPDGKHVIVGMMKTERVAGKPKVGEQKVGPKAEVKETSILALWDVGSGKQLKDLGVQKGVVTALAFSANATHALSAHLGADVQIWDLEKGKSEASVPVPKAGPKGEPDVVFAVAFHADGDKVLLGFGKELVLWDIANKKAIHTFKGHDDLVLVAVVSADGKRAATSGSDQSIRLWDLEKGAEIGSLKKQPASQGQIALAFVDGSKVLAVWTGVDLTAGNQPLCEVALWDGQAKKTLWAVKSHFKGMVPIAVQSKGNEATLGGGPNFFSRWDLNDGAEAKIWGGHKGAVNALAVVGNGAVFSGGQDGVIKLWNKGSPGKTLTGHSDAVNALAISKDGQFLISGSADKTVKLWDAVKGRLIKTFTGHMGSVTGVAMSSNFEWIVSGSNDRTVKVWDVVTGKVLQELAGHAEGINGIALAPDANWVASAGDDATIRLWPLKDGKLDNDRDPLVLEDHQRQVNCVAFSPDGARLLSGSQDKTVKVWDVQRAKVLKNLEGHKNWVSAVVFLDGGKMAASASDDLTVRFWDLESGKETAFIDLSPNSDCPRSLAFIDGRNFLVGTSGWVVLSCQLGDGKKK